MSEVKTPTPESGAVIETAQHTRVHAVTKPQNPTDSQLTDASSTDPQHPEPILGFIAPYSALGKELTKIGHEFDSYRDSTVHALPGFIVNHSSNIIGTTHLTGEALMFKASGNQLYQGSKIGKDGSKTTDYFHGAFQQWLENKHPSLSAAKGTGLTPRLLRGANPLIEPIHNILQNAVATAGFEFKAADLLKPKFYKETAESFVDLEKATEIDRALLAPGQKLVNRWQTRATFLGMLGMTVSTLLPDDKDSPEEVKKRTELATLHPVQYIGHRIATAINPLTWWDNKRAFIGFMMTLCGVSTFLAGFRNVSGENKYFRNSAHGYGGIITAIAGSQLIMSPSSDQGWARWGSIMWLRMGFLPKSISKRYEKLDPNANFYSLGQAALQTSNFESFMFGGAEKLADGTIIDHKTISLETKQKAREEKEKRHIEKVEAKHHAAEEKHTPHAHADQSTHITPEKSAEITAVPNTQPASNDAIYTPHATVATEGAVHTLPERTNAVAAA